MAAVSTTTLATPMTMMGTSAHFSHVEYSTFAIMRPGRNAAVGLNRFARPFAATKIITMTSGENPSEAANDPMMGMDSVASADVDVMMNDSPKNMR